jgi:hypothetical protein
MEVNGIVKNGVIIFDSDVKIPEGARVVVHFESVSDKDQLRDTSRPYTLGEKMRKLAGTLEGMPADFAEQHDHYIHGTPKR